MLTSKPGGGRSQIERAGSLVNLTRQYNWRRLLVRRRLRRVAELLAPRITSGATAEAPLIVAGLLSQTCGLGAAARACYSALEASGLPVYGVDLTAALRYERDYLAFKYIDGSNAVGKGTILLHVNGPWVPAALAQLGRRFVRDKRIVGHWFWELSEVPEDWRPALSFVHDVFVNTHFVADAVRPLSGRTPLHIVPYPLPAAGKIRKGYSITDNTFTVLFTFNVLSNFARKNPCGAIEAFRRAFGNDPSARLMVKYVNAASWPESERRMQAAAGDAPNIELIGDLRDDDSMERLYHRADVILSLHRAEGLGLVIAEAMLRGKPVIATNYSGSMDFLTTETGIPIGYDLVPVVDPQGNYVDGRCSWADPHIDEAAAALRALRADPHIRERLGRAAVAFAADFFSPARYVDQVKGILKLAA